MINETQIVDLVIEKIWRAIGSKYDPTNQATLIPYANVYEIMGRKGFCKSEARLIGHFFQSKGLLQISKHGWLIKTS